MTDITKYRNISVTHKVYSDLESISKVAGKTNWSREIID